MITIWFRGDYELPEAIIFISIKLGMNIDYTSYRNYSPEPFVAIGRFYGDFGQVGDVEVKKIERRHGYKVKE